MSTEFHLTGRNINIYKYKQSSLEVAEENRSCFPNKHLRLTNTMRRKTAQILSVKSGVMHVFVYSHVTFLTQENAVDLHSLSGVP
jgi:hypothetical protein